VLAHVPEVRSKHGTPYLYSGRAGPFGLSCLHAHSARHAMNNPLIKKQVNTLFSYELLNQQNMMIIIFEYLIHDHNNISDWMDRALNESCRLPCCNGPPASRAEPCSSIGSSGGSSTIHWLMPGQARPMALWAVPCLNQTKFRVPLLTHLTRPLVRASC
jgi:hypothetical protein